MSLVAAGLLSMASIFYSDVLIAGPGMNGKVGWKGLVIESACALHPSSYEQHIVASEISPDRLIRNGGSELHPFSVSLINCSLKRKNKDDWTAFTITFDGESDRGYFALKGSGAGLAIEIQDERGHIALPGKSMEPHPVVEGEKTLNYHLRLVGNSELLRPGNHFALIKYKLDYY
jgi:type 1 fimbria pilin